MGLIVQRCGLASLWLIIFRTTGIKPVAIESIAIEGLKPSMAQSVKRAAFNMLFENMRHKGTNGIDCPTLRLSGLASLRLIIFRTTGIKPAAIERIVFEGFKPSKAQPFKRAEFYILFENISHEGTIYTSNFSK